MGSALSAIQGWEQKVRVIDRCRICGNTELHPIIDLGSQCLAGLFDDGRPQNQLEIPVPLAAVCCAGEAGCGFVQLTHTVPPEVMFQDYGYRSGLNTTMRRHLESLSAEIESRIPLKAGEIAVDIGANDGTGLLAYREPGLIRVGFEPSDAGSEIRDERIQVIRSFFSSGEFLKRFPAKRAKVVTSIAMFYDIDDPAAFCRQIHEILDDQGLWVLELHYWGDVLDQTGFDAICHEHLGYYSLATLGELAQRCGFEFEDVSFNSSNGGSVRCTLRKTSSRLPRDPEARRRVERAFSEEKRRDLDSPERHARFRANAAKIRSETREILQRIAREGKSVYGYGASTKGNVLLQYCGVTASQIVAIADRNPAKHGRKTPGTGIPICSEEQMRRACPDYLLILPWHFLPEFLEREKDLRAAGTRFIVPFPEPRIL